MRVPDRIVLEPVFFFSAVLPVCYQRENIRDDKKSIVIGFYTSGVVGNWASLRAASIAAAISRTRLRPTSTEGHSTLSLFVRLGLPFNGRRRSCGRLMCVRE